MTEPGEFSELELDALKELMNIGFGQAACVLSEVIDVHVVLSVPKISVLNSEEIADFIRGEVNSASAYSMVEQFFFGRFGGTSFLLLPEDEGRKLVSLFGIDESSRMNSLELGSLERETVIEIGNIIIGACVGKIAEILNDQVTFQPPRYLSSPMSGGLIERHLGKNANLALVFKTLFNFEHREVYGLLFLVASEESLDWMRSAVDSYLRSLE